MGTDGMPSCCESLPMNNVASSCTSSSRSLRGGKRICITLMRKKRSARNRPLSTSFSSSAWWRRQTSDRPAPRAPNPQGARADPPKHAAACSASRRKFTHLIEKQRSTLGVREKPLAHRFRAGESSFDMAKEFSLDHIVRDSGRSSREQTAFQPGPRASESNAPPLPCRSRTGPSAEPMWASVRRARRVSRTR